MGRILVIDDDPDLAQSLADVLELRGYEVALAYSGDAGLEEFARQPCQVAVIDVRMPGKDGIACCAELRLRDPRVRVVLMTGYTAESEMRRARESGATAVLEKPFDLDAMLALVEHRSAE